MGGGCELLADSFEDVISELIVVDDLFATVNGYSELLEDE